MATNTNNHQIDDSGNVVVDFVWGNMPMQPNDDRAENGGSLLDYTLDSHNIVEDGWNGYPLYTPNSAGSQTAGVDYITVPNVLGSVATDAAALLGDLELNTTIASAASNSAKTVTAASRASSSNLAVVTASGAGAAYAIGTKVTIASVDATVNQYGKTGEIIKSYKFVGLFPQDLAPIDLDWGSNDSIEEYAVTFAYQWWEALTTS